MTYLHDACIVIVIRFNPHNISNEGGVTTHLAELCVLKLKKKSNKTLKTTPPNQNARLQYFFLPNRKCCLSMPAVCSSSPSLSRQGLGLQGTAVNHLQPSHTLAMLLQDLRLDTAKSAWMAPVQGCSFVPEAISFKSSLLPGMGERS